MAAEAASDAERDALRALLGPLGYSEGRRYCWTPSWLWEPGEPGPEARLAERVSRAGRR